MLIYRVLSAIVGIPLLLLLVSARGGTPFAIAIGLLSLIGVHEFYRGVRQTGAKPIEPLGWIGCVLCIASVRDFPLHIDVFWWTAFPVLLFLSALVWDMLRKDRAPIRNVGATVLGVLYVGLLITYLVLLRGPHESTDNPPLLLFPPGWFGEDAVGIWLVFFAFFTTWACDTGAYFAGRAFGKHKLAPSLSPGKTIEGALGGVVGSVVVAALVGSLLGFPLWSRFVLGIAVAVAAVLGDLTESAMKREIGIKDFGSIIPGHGGVLDRFDSMLFVGPTVYYLVNLMGLV